MYAGSEVSFQAKLSEEIGTGVGVHLKADFSMIWVCKLIVPICCHVCMRSWQYRALLWRLFLQQYE